MKKLSKDTTEITRDIFAYFAVGMQVFVIVGSLLIQFFFPFIVFAILFFSINNYIRKINWLFKLADLYHNGEEFIVKSKNDEFSFIKDDIISLKVRTGKVKLVTKKGIFYFLYKDKYDLYFYFDY